MVKISPGGKWNPLEDQHAGRELELHRNNDMHLIARIVIFDRLGTCMFVSEDGT